MTTASPDHSRPVLTGQTVVITEGGSDFGLELGRLFGQSGAHTVLADGDPAFAEVRAAALQREGLSASFARLDGRDPAQSRALVERLVAERGAIDVWVNGAADAAHTGPAETLTPSAWEDSLATLLSGAFYCAQAVGAHMLRRGRGVIVNVAAVDAYQAREGHAAHSAAHAGLVALTQALGVEWAGRGVRVVGVAPGPRPGPSDGATTAAYQRRTPLRRLGTSEDIAQAVFFLASDEAAFIVGETMRVDGGWTAYHLF